MVGQGSEWARAGAVLVGLPDFEVLASGEVGGEIELLVQLRARVEGCPKCGVVAKPKGRRAVLVRDLPARGRPVTLVWSKRLWRCAEQQCPMGSWSQTHPEIAPRAVLTERARRWACEQVGRCKRSTAAVAAELGVGWSTAWSAVEAYGTPLVEDPARLAGVSAVGVDEHKFLAATATKATTYATGVVDVTPGRPPRLLDVLDGRSGKIYADWLAERDQQWRDRVAVAALDPFRGYSTALSAQLPAAQQVLRRLPRRQARFHRAGRGPHPGAARHPRSSRPTRRPALRHPTGGPPRPGQAHPHARQRLLAGLVAGDPDGEVAAAWTVAQQLREVYQAPTAADGERRAAAVEAAALSCPVPEVRRLGRTLRSWRPEWLAYFHTGKASNGPVEAINLNIETSRRVGYGYRNFGHYRLRLLLAYGDVWTHPAATPRLRAG